MCALVTGFQTCALPISPDLNHTSGASGALGVSLPRTFLNAVCPELVEACPERLQGSRRGLSFLSSVAGEKDGPSTSSGRTVLGSEFTSLPPPRSPVPPRSEESRVGKEGVSRGRSRWSP